MKNIQTEKSYLKTPVGVLGLTTIINKDLKRIDVIVDNATIEALNIPRKIMGTAKCHESDEFSVKWGINMAKNRALKSLYKNLNANCEEIIRDLNRKKAFFNQLISTQNSKIEYSINKKYPSTEDSSPDLTKEVEINQIDENEVEINPQ